MNYRIVSAADVGIQLSGWARPREAAQERTGTGPGSRPGDEHASPPGGDATLLAVVPIPGTGTSLAIVGYVTFQEFELLAFLTAHPATVFTRAELVERVWHRRLGRDGRPVARDSRTADVHVSRVRHKLGPRYGQCLVTEYRVGYQYRPLPA